MRCIIGVAAARTTAGSCPADTIWASIADDGVQKLRVNVVRSVARAVDRDEVATGLRRGVSRLDFNYVLTDSGRAPHQGLRRVLRGRCAAPLRLACQCNNTSARSWPRCVGPRLRPSAKGSSRTSVLARLGALPADRLPARPRGRSCSSPLCMPPAWSPPGRARMKALRAVCTVGSARLPSQRLRFARHASHAPRAANHA
eukprot:scaffold257831_cov31-Tisochrysis_lutea.AAC.8